jgi:parallel beta-helix repeat protein
VQNCTISDNYASVGSGVYCSSAGTVQNCTISDNWGVGVSMWDGGTVQNCTISDNSGSGVSMWDGGTAQNCTISGNSAAGFWGGGITMSGGGTVQNCTITGNSAEGGGGVLCDGGGTVQNCIIYFNTAPAGDPNYLNSGTGWSYAYCCTTPLVPGEGNFEAAPLLTPDLRLRADSPCIDAGSASNAPPADMDGEARWDHLGHPNVVSIVDVGADEFVDTDGDALADAWESTHAGNLGWDAATDNDVNGGSDGLSALEEYHEGTDPNKSDTDDDLLMDGQEIVIGTDPLAPDTDGDEQRDGEEMIAGTNPLNAADYFSLQQVMIDPAIKVPVISWQSVTGRLYTLSVSADLINEVWASVSGYANLPGTGAEIAYTNPVPHATELYRVQVRLADVPSPGNFDMLYFLFEAGGPRIVLASFDRNGTFEDSAGNTGTWVFQHPESRLVFATVGSARSALFFGSESSNGVLIGLKMSFPELELFRWFGVVINGALPGAR